MLLLTINILIQLQEQCITVQLQVMRVQQSGYMWGVLRALLVPKEKQERRGLRVFRGLKEIREPLEQREPLEHKALKLSLIHI